MWGMVGGFQNHKEFYDVVEIYICEAFRSLMLPVLKRINAIKHFKRGRLVLLPDRAHARLIGCCDWFRRVYTS